ncbi:MAG: ester cyclase, partial [Mycobacterium sp.]|jgi:predicted ester cyclase
LNDFVAEDGKVAVRWTSRVTHSGEVFGIPATNRRVTVTGIEIYRLTDGRCSEFWGELNLSDLSEAP